LDAVAAAAALRPLCWNVMLAAAADQFSQVTFACATMVSHFIFPFASALLAFSSLLVVFSSEAAFQCQENVNDICTGVCCNYKDPYRLLVGPTCNIQAFWFSSENGTVWPFPTFRFSYYWDQESTSNGSIMVGKAAKPKEETTEVLTMHPNWESHVNEDTNSGIFFSLFNVHMSCIMSTLIFCLCIMVCILLGYLGYCRFCHCLKRKSKEALEATSSSFPPAPLTSRSWATMEDKYEMDDYGGAV
jgi:hypothetical protein